MMRKPWHSSFNENNYNNNNNTKNALVKHKVCELIFQIFQYTS